MVTVFVFVATVLVTVGVLVCKRVLLACEAVYTLMTRTSAETVAVAVAVLVTVFTGGVTKHSQACLITFAGKRISCGRT